MEMDRQAKNVWLNRYRESVKRQQHLQFELDEVRSRATSLVYSISTTKSSSTGSHADRVADNAVRIADLERELQEEQERGERLALEIIRAIYDCSTVHNPQHTNLLYKHYIQGVTLKEIAYETWSTSKSVGEKKRRALDNLKLEQ